MDGCLNSMATPRTNAALPTTKTAAAALAIQAAMRQAARATSLDHRLHRANSRMVQISRSRLFVVRSPSASTSKGFLISGTRVMPVDPFWFELSSLGNTATVCRKCYVHPAIIDAYLDRSLLKPVQKHAEGKLEKIVERP